MSTFIKLYNGEPLPVFNIRNYSPAVKLTSVQADSIVSTNITSNSVTSSAYSQSNNSGTQDAVATQLYCDGKVTSLKNELLGPDLSSSFDTLKEISDYAQNNGSAITSLISTVSNKANQSDLNTLASQTSTYDNHFTQLDSSFNILLSNQLSDEQHLSVLDSSYNMMKTNYDSHFSVLDSSMNSVQTSINSLNSKTSSLSYSSGTTTINSKLSVNLDDTLKGNTTIGDQLTDTLVVNAITTFNNPSVTFQNNSIQQSAVNGLSSKISNHDTHFSTLDSSFNSLYSQIATDENTIATHTSQISSLSSSKADLANTLYQNTYYVNAGVNKFSDVLTAIGSSNGKFSTGSHNNESGTVTIDKVTLNLIAPDNAFASSSAVVYYPITISGSSCTRILVSNFQFTQPIVINGTQGRHNWKACTFTNSFTFQGSMTNWCNFQYCTFSNVITVPNTFAGTIVFFQCDLTGCTINLNQASPYQVIFNSCIGLSSLSLNASFLGYNTLADLSSALNTTSLNVQGATSFPNNSISQSSVNGLTSALSSKLNTTDAQNTYATISNLGTTNTNVTNLTTRVGTAESDITNLKSKTNVLLYDSGTDTLSINSKVSITKDSVSQNATINLGDSTSDTLYIKSNIIANSQTITPVQLSYVSGATSNIQTQLNSRALDSAVVRLVGDQTVAGNKQFTGTTSGITKSMVGLGNVDNTSDLNKPISTATQGALDLKANITYVDDAVANLVNSAPSSLNQLNELASALGNNPNYATDMVTALALKANDNAVVKLSGNQSITGTKDFATIQLGGTDLNTRITNIESKDTSQDSSISTLNTNVSNLQSKTNALSYDSNTDTLSISSKVNISKDLSDVGSVYLGDNVGNDVIYLRGNLNVLGTTNITQTELSRLSGVSSGIQSQLNARVTTNTTQSITGQKNFTGGLQINGTDLDTRISNIESVNATQSNNISSLQSGKQDALSYDTSPVQNSTNSMTSGSIYTALGLKQDTSAMSNYYTKTAADSLLSGKQNTISYDSVPTSASSNSLTSGSIYTALGLKQDSSAMSNYYTKTAADSLLNAKQNTLTIDSSVTQNSTNPVQSGAVYSSLQNYQPTSSMSSYLSQSSASSTYAPINNAVHTGTTTFNEIVEQITSVSSITNALSLDYSAVKGVVYVQTPTSNLSLTLTNLSTSSTNASYTITLVIPSKYYVNSCTVNGTSRTIYFNGGSANVSINASATFVLQTLTFAYLNSSTPVVMSNVASIF